MIKQLSILLVLLAGFSMQAQKRSFSMEEAVTFALDSNYTAINSQRDIAKAIKQASIVRRLRRLLNVSHRWPHLATHKPAIAKRISTRICHQLLRHHAPRKALWLFCHAT